jgi:hemerythrin-like domain-containing protein
MAGEIKKIEKTRDIYHEFIVNAVDFFHIYADQTHHGKEENILFRDLFKKDISDAERTLAFELMKEHVLGRTVTNDLFNAANSFQNGDDSAMDTVLQNMKKLVDFYPKHIEKEDKIFFPAIMGYFSENEQKLMLNEFWDFDRTMIHSKYKSVVGMLEGSGK